MKTEIVQERIALIKMPVHPCKDCAALSAALESLLRACEGWCDAVERDSSWDGWDHHYKAMKYGSNGAASHIAAARAAIAKATA